MSTKSAGKKKARRPIKSRTKVRRSGVHGKGVYATTPIRKGTRIIEYTGQRLPWKKAMDLPRPQGRRSVPHVLLLPGKWGCHRRRGRRKRIALDQPFLRSELRDLRRRRSDLCVCFAQPEAGGRAFLRLQDHSRGPPDKAAGEGFRLPLRQREMPGNDVGAEVDSSRREGKRGVTISPSTPCRGEQFLLH